MSAGGALRDVAWEACLLEPRRDAALEREVRRAIGAVPFGVPYFTPVPWIVRAIVGFGQPRLVHVDPVLADLVGMVVGQDNSCRYCYATQRTLMRLQGYSERRILQLEDDWNRARFAPRERAALEFARLLSRGIGLDARAAHATLTTAGWHERALPELAFLAAAHVFLNRVHTLPAIPPQRMERMSTHWALRWVSPVTRLVLRSYQERGVPETLGADGAAGPFAYVVRALDGLPVARALRSILDDAFASGALPAGARALVFATVARGLSDAPAEREARRLALEAGLSAAELDRVLTHLGAPELGAVERLAVPFARETVRCRPVEIQRSARTLHAQIPADAFLDLIGIAALANAVTRLSLALATG